MGTSLGYGSSVLLRVMEGKGEILPGPPKGSGPKTIHIDPISMKVGKFVAQLKRADREFIKLYYLEDAYNIEEKAKMLRVQKRVIYRWLHGLQLKLILYMEGEER